ncbi:uncharacterized protein LOC125951181 [Anopheles darlingi]|uniref:uncharacterized protein LOC125951181 n=1 Tax=Anopheles darlingi TaxID=43151 RepID=UPI002100065B|nr:uncharacterized protein LOC125951181 [Anopheles darlingi]
MAAVASTSGASQAQATLYCLLLLELLQLVIPEPLLLLQQQHAWTHTLDETEERLVAIGQRFLSDRTDTRLLVFLQFPSDATVAGDMLTLTLRSLAVGRPSLVLREDAAPAATLATILAAKWLPGSTADGAEVALIVLLSDTDLPDRSLLRPLLQAFPVTQKLLLVGEPAPGCPGEAADLTLTAAGKLLEEMWRSERIIRLATLWYRACPGRSTIPALLYDPFQQPVTEGGSWGGVTLVRDAARAPRPLPVDAEWFGWRHLNLHRMPLELYGFEAVMANRRQDLDMLLLRSSTPDSRIRADGYLGELFGADVEALAELAHRMNFRPRVQHEPANFGFRTVYGTYTGVLGRLVTHRDSWMSLNVYFLKDYETRAIHFTAAVYQDSLCVFVKAAGMLPDWLLIFRCFTPVLWLANVASVAVATLCYAAITRLTVVPRPGPGSRWPRTRSAGIMVSAMMNAPIERLDGTTGRQKLLIGLALLWGLTLSGAFQGSLVDVYTTPRSRRNLDTLAELDASGLPIAVSAPALAVDVFGNGEASSSASRTIASLRHRLLLVSSSNSSNSSSSSKGSGWSVVAGQTAALIRKQDFGRLSMKYLGRDGTPRVHRLRECPRSYTLAYLYPRGSPLYAAANQHILHFLQHGLYARWQSDAGHLLALNRALKVARLLRQRTVGTPVAGGRVALGLQHLLLPFLLLAAGHTLAALGLLWEHQRSRRRRRR